MNPTPPAVAAAVVHGDAFMKAIALAAYWHIQYDNSNPDVGMGCSNLYFAQQALAEVGAVGLYTPEQILAVVERM